MSDILGAVLGGTIFLVLVALAIYVVVSNSGLLTVVGICAVAGGVLGYLGARRTGRRYMARG